MVFRAEQREKLEADIPINSVVHHCFDDENTARTTNEFRRGLEVALKNLDSEGKELIIHHTAAFDLRLTASLAQLAVNDAVPPILNAP